MIINTMNESTTPTPIDTRWTKPIPRPNKEVPENKITTLYSTTLRTDILYSVLTQLFIFLIPFTFSRDGHMIRPWHIIFKDG